MQIEAAKVAIVTGGADGIGKATALKLGGLGYNVVVADINYEAAKSVTNEIQEMGVTCLPLNVDVSSGSDIRLMAREIDKVFGKIDLLVNNAGTNIPYPSEDLPEEIWDKIININLKGTWLCSQEIGRIMIREKYGCIINISSIEGLTAFPGRAPYDVSKHGVIALAKVLGIEWAKYNIRVNSVAPGFVNTSLVRGIINKGTYSLDQLQKRTPNGRLAEPEDIANIVAFLASDEARHITAETITVDGGWVAYGYL